MKTLTSIGATATVVAVACFTPIAGHAQSYPERPITVVVSGQVGGTIDGVARTLAPFWGEALGQPLEIDNRSGAGGVTGVRHFMEQPRDGYTIMIGTEAHYTASLESDESLKSTDIELINMMQFDPVALTVLEASGFDNLEALVGHIKENPDSVTWGSVANGVPALIGQILERDWDLDVRFVPQSGGSESDTALLGGHVDFKMGTAKGDSSELPGAKVLAVAAPERLEYLPEVPTFSEVGAALGNDAEIPNLGSARLIWVHADMKEQYPERFEVLVNALREAMDNPKYRAILEESGEAPHTLLLDPQVATQRFRDLSANSIKFRSELQ